MTKKTIYLIRHGQTQFNKMGIVQGSGIDSELNDEGHRQAEKFFFHFKHVPFERIYVTELKRTHQSIAPFRSLNIPIEIIPEFNEINWGILEGKEPTEENRKQFFEISGLWKQGHLDIAISGGETPLDMYNRQKFGLKKVLESEHETVLICMHGRAIRSFLCLLTGQHLKDMDEFHHENLCLYEMRQKENGLFDIIRGNYVDHLKS